MTSAIGSPSAASATSTRPQLLFLTQRIPYPPTKGEKIRQLQILQHLRQSYDIHLGCLVDDPRDREHIPTIQAMCVSSHFASIDRRWAKIACLRGLLTNEALSVTFFRNRGLLRWVRNAIAEVRPSVIFVCSSNIAPYILNEPSTARVRLVDLADVDSEKWLAYSRAANFPMNWVYAREWRLTAQLEGRILRDCDWSTFVSNDEAALFARAHPADAGKIRAVSNGVDHIYFDPTQRFDPPYATDRLNFVFTGTMDYPPNVDAVAWFAREIMPLIRQRAPGAQFHIVGSSPAPAVQKLAEIDGVFVTGRVADVRPFVAHATACVAPMRIARGIQNKVLEAMAMARPVVVTSDALEGIDATPGQELLLANTTEDIAAACLRLADPGPATAIGQAARARILKDYVWSELLRGFDRLLGSVSPHRAA